MINNKQWNPERIYIEEQEWIRVSKAFSFDEPREVLRKFAKGEELEYGLVDLAASFHELAVWYESTFIVEAFQENDTAARSLALSFEYNFWESVTITSHWSSFEEIHFGKGLDDYSSYLSKGISIECLKESKILGDLILNNRRKKRMVHQ